MESKINKEYLIAGTKDKKAEERQAARFAMTLFCTMAVFAPQFAFAGGMPWDGAADWVLASLNGGLTRTIAIICVIACGIAAWAGKLSIDWAVKIVIGIVFVFGAAAIVDGISGAVA